MKKESGDELFYLRGRPWPTPDYFYAQALQGCLYSHPEDSIRLLVDYVRKDSFAFDMANFWFCLTGMKKVIYNGIFKLNATEYMRIFEPLKDQISAILFAQNWSGDVFLVYKADEKQIAVIMSPLDNARCTAEELADIIGRLVQQTYEREIFKGDTRFRNVTALCGPSSGYEAIRESYHAVRALNDLSFLHMDGRVLTQEEIARSKNDADYASILDMCFELRSFLDEGDCTQTSRRLRRLFLETIRGSYSLALCDDALSFIKSMLQVRCTVYGVETDCPLDTLCSRQSYHKVEECVNALLPVFSALCAAVRVQGAYSKPVLSAIYYIKKHFAGYLILPDVARYANTNASYLSSKFKEETGFSVRNYINKVRLETAQQLLLESSDTVAAVARQVGFEDVRYFTRVFKQFAHCTPTEYRQGHHGQQPLSFRLQRT